MASEGPARLERLLLQQALVDFDREPDGELTLGQEAAHSRRRILHVSDRTGRSIIEALTAAMRRQPNIELMTNATAVDLITYPHHSPDPLDTYQPVTCHGAYIFDRTAEVVHPTTLAVTGAYGFLISEAVRGEGGILLTPDGQPFMHKYDPQWRDLAPRDVVARAIHHEIEANDYPYVLLDIASHMPAAQIKVRFPTIYAECLRVGIDITQQPIPVMPAVHYSCGGVAVNTWGESTIKNLYAVGEVACTGLHGANRLASTSLLEGVVFGGRAAEHVLQHINDHVSPDGSLIPRWDESTLTQESDPALIQGDMQTIQNIMWHYVGIVRSGVRLSRAIRELRHLQNEIEMFYRTTKLNDGLIGLRNAVVIGLVIAQAARHNRKSRGCHYRSDSL